MRRVLWRGSALFLVLLALGGCQSGSAADENPPLPTSRDEAAAVLISADVAAPWDDVANAMQPKFDLATGDAALKKGVLPATAEIQNQVLNAFNLSAALSAAYGGPASKAPSTPSSGATSPLTLPPIQKPTEPIGVDPALQYQAALALFQQVQLMNAQIQNVERDSDSIAYLVQLRLTVMPYRRDLPYDLHARVSFFAYHYLEGGTIDKHTCPVALPHIVPLLATDDLERALTSEAAETARQFSLGLSAALHGLGGTLQTGTNNQKVNSAEGQDINSLFTVGRLSDNTIYVRIGSSYQSSEKAEKSDNALVGKNYDVSLILLVPKAYFACLTKVSQKPVIDIVGKSQFREASLGSRLAERPLSKFVEQLDRYARDLVSDDPTVDVQAAWNATPPATKLEIGREWLYGVEDNDYGEFLHWLRRTCLPVGSADHGLSVAPEPKTPEGSKTPCVKSIADAVIDPDILADFWVDLSGALGDFEQLQATLELPRPKPVVVLRRTNREVLLIDRGKSGAQIELTNVSGPAAHVLTATLFLKGTGQNGPFYPFAAQSMKLDQTTGTLTLGFESPTDLGLTKITSASYLELDYKHPSSCANPATARPYCASGALKADDHDCRRGGGENCFKVVMLHSSATEAKEPGLSFTAKTDTVIAVHGEGKVTVTVAKLKDASAKISVAGAEYSSAVDGSGKTVAGPNQGLVVKQNSTITYALRNLTSGAAFTITAEGQDAAGASTGSHTLKFVVAK